MDQGERREEIVRLLGVSLATIGRYVRRGRETADVAPGPSPGRRARICRTTEERQALWAQQEANPEATLKRHCELREQEHGARVSVVGEHAARGGRGARRGAGR